MIIIRLNTHTQTTPSKLPKFLVAMFCVGVSMLYFIFLLAAFACFTYAKSVLGGIFVIIVPIAITVWVYITVRDMSNAYIEIDGNSICVVDYHLGIKKKKMFSFSDITSAEIVPGYSHRVKGYRYSAMGTHYIILKNDTKYLFKIIYLPETASIFEDYIS